jgi:hypothetical protein
VDLDYGVQIAELCSERTGQRPSNLGQECFSEEILFFVSTEKGNPDIRSKARKCAVSQGKTRNGSPFYWGRESGREEESVVAAAAAAAAADCNTTRNGRKTRNRKVKGRRRPLDGSHIQGL